jgi:outer membrane lipoprotein carrier protein
MVLAASIVLGAGGGEDPPLDPLSGNLSPRERLDVLVERVKLEQSRVETMTAEFEQYKESSLLLEPETAQGVFYYRAPDRVRWEYRQPDPVIMTITEDIMLTYYPDLERAESVSIGRYSEQVFKYMGASGSLETLMKYFSVTAEFPERQGEPYHLELLPKYARIKNRLHSMQLWIDGESFLPVAFEYTEPGGDLTRYRFSALRTNVELGSDRFDLELPPSVEVRAVDLKSGG